MTKTLRSSLQIFGCQQKLVWSYFSLNEQHPFDDPDKSVITYAPHLGMPSKEARLWRVHSITCVSYVGMSALLALLLRRFPVVSVLEKIYSLSSPLHAALSGDNIQAIRLLVLAQADVNERGGSMYFPLLAAISMNRPKS